MLSCIHCTDTKRLLIDWLFVYYFQTVGWAIFPCPRAHTYNMKYNHTHVHACIHTYIHAYIKVLQNTTRVHNNREIKFHCLYYYYLCTLTHTNLALTIMQTHTQARTNTCTHASCTHKHMHKCTHCNIVTHFLFQMRSQFVFSITNNPNMMLQPNTSREVCTVCLCVWMFTALRNYYIVIPHSMYCPIVVVKQLSSVRKLEIVNTTFNGSPFHIIVLK